MEKSEINNLKEGSVFWDNDFQYKVTKVYKHGTIVHGVQATYTWKNDFGTFYEKIYLSKKDLLADEYDCGEIGCVKDKEDEIEKVNSMTGKQKRTAQLKSCPFCGSEAEIAVRYHTDEGCIICVGCPKCFCKIKKNLWFDFNESIIQYNIEVMVNKWNKRH